MPARRPRRNRQSAAIRWLVEEHRLHVKDLIFPLFVLEGSRKKIEVQSMPGIYRFSEDLLLQTIEDALELGIQGFDIFPVVDEVHKDKEASKSHDPNFFYLKTLRKIKETFPEAFIMTDVAMDPYSSDGHDGLVEDGKILNDESLEILGQMSLAQADCGIDMIGPSDMMDGRVGYLRQLLDTHNYTSTGIFSYTAKYASAFYGPFRDALQSSPKFGNKKTYQMNPANRKEALLEAALDVEEGADVLMVKPAMPYLDIISDLQAHFEVPIAAYHVSGEYSMVAAAAANGWIDRQQVAMESLTSLKRAGADIILTYFAMDAAKWIKDAQ